MKLTASIMLTVDGVYQGPGGPDEDRRGGFERGGWTAAHADPEMWPFLTSWFERADALLLGRKTWEIWEPYWPLHDSGDPVSHGINVLPKYVPSTTLKHPTWQNTHVIEGDLLAAVRELKAKPGRELQLHGSGVLLRRLRTGAESRDLRSTVKEDRHMGKVVAGGTVSLDGYIAGPNESGFEHLFAWLAGGDFEFPSLNPDVRFRLTEPDYRYFRDVNERIGVHVIGRRLFDLTDGWGGRHPFDKPIIVVTHSVPEGWVAAHPDAPVTFVTDGLPSAIERARAIAGDLNVSVTAGKIASQCLELGLLDEIWIDLVPVLLGSGVRFFDELSAAPILLDGPNLLVEGSRVTHLRYQVRR